MNELDPALKRLMRWGRAAAQAQADEAPFGFAGRVLACRQRTQDRTLLFELQQTALGLACASLVVILCGGFVLLRQPSPPPPAAELSTALTFVANHLPQ
jgi:hypothetical protein